MAASPGALSRAHRALPAGGLRDAGSPSCQRSFVAIADRADGEGLRLNPVRGCFFEFLPVEELGSESPTRHWAATIETGVEYAVVVSSCAGLFAYVLGDTVRFLDHAPLRLLVKGGASWTLSAFGEHRDGAEIEAALMKAARPAGIAVAEYCVGPDSLGHAGRLRPLDAGGGKARPAAQGAARGGGPGALRGDGRCAQCSWSGAASELSSV